jgi:hypothetical protein
MSRFTPALLALSALALLGAGCSEAGDSGAAGPAGTGTSSASTPRAEPTEAAETVRPVDDILVKRYDVGQGPDWMATDEHGLWMMRDLGSTLLIDPVSGEILGEVDTGRYELPLCQGIGAGYGAVYVCRGTDLLRIDAATRTV